MSAPGREDAPEIRARKVDAALEREYRDLGLEPWVARFLAGRLDGPVDPRLLRTPTLAALPDPEGIPGMARAVERILLALERRERIVCACDHDVDGTASAAVLAGAFLDVFGHPPERFGIVTSHRIREGYGITEPVVDRILAAGATLVITADKGSGDEPRIHRLREAGVDVIVTDHHGLGPEGPPPSAFACLNPCRPDASYDRTICGAAVAFVTVVKVARARAAAGHDPGRIFDLIDFVGVATIADCVSLRPDLGVNNRAFVRRALARINRGSRPCWRVLLRSLRGGIVNEETVAFRLAPPINASGRLDWSDLAIRFFRAATDEEAEALWRELERENLRRRRVDTRLTERAFGLLRPGEAGDEGVVLFFDEDGHVGVQGIVASRIAEATGRPTVVLSRVGAGDRAATTDGGSSDGLLTGSARGIAGFHVREALQSIADACPGLLVSFGGHAGAGGLRLREADLETFRAEFGKAVARAFPHGVRPVVEVDGFVDGHDLPPDLAARLAELAPFGKDFPPPLFCGRLGITAARPLGSGTHFRLEVQGPAGPLPALWFARERRGESRPPSPGDAPLFVYGVRRREGGAHGGAPELELQIYHRLAPGSVPLGTDPCSL